MIIANPIYDVVFKKLMEDKRIAKFFISTLINREIQDIEVKPQEYTYTDELAGLAVFRYDFIAKIRTGNNAYKNVLIEIQKAKNAIDIMRFRNYLAEQYKREDEILNKEGKKEITPLPIITIYLLGFKLLEIETPALKVNREYLDLITGRKINKRSEFIEKLTHDSYIVQIPRITSKLQNKLEKLLSVFEQSNFTDEKGLIKDYLYEIKDDEILVMLETLREAGAQPEMRKEIAREQEAFRILDLAAREKTKELHKEINAKDKEIDERDKEIIKKDKEILEKEQLIKELQQSLKEKKA